MVEISVADASGIIAAAVFIVQLFIPLAVALALVGLVREQEAAVTWSVLGRTLQSTYWPMILRTDTAAGTGVRRTVKAGVFLLPGALGVLAVASIVTPLGLYDGFAPAPNKALYDFQYVKDPTVMGSATPPRSPLPFNRQCGSFYDSACPGSNTIVLDRTNDTRRSSATPFGYNVTIPQNVTDVFDSGRAGLDSSVSSIWDIQWRSYTHRSEEVYNNGSRRVQGSYRPIQQVFLEEDYVVVEGLVVDGKRGGIGFRNHTVPTAPGHGVTWEEDLLWVQPESSCVNTNLTLDLTLGDVGSIEHLALTDHGGFINVPRRLPNRTYASVQEELDLAYHAFRGAYINNMWTMFYMNITNPANKTTHTELFQYLNSHIGKNFTIPSESVSARAIRTGGLAMFIKSLSLSESNTTNATAGTYSNPFNLSYSDFDDIDALCQQTSKVSPVNIDSVAVNCGVIYGAATPSDGSSASTWDPMTTWSIPLYTCASATKALIKTVHFSYNGTGGLKDLHVLDIRDKQYDRTEDLPYWGVEHREDMMIGDVNPVWGIVSAEYKDHPGLTVVQKEHLWLPDGQSMLSIGYSSDNLPAAQFSHKALRAAYEIGSSSSDFSTSASESIADYSGQTNAGMFTMWQNMTQTPDGSATVFNLIWTDIAANAVVGTRAYNWSVRPESFARADDQEIGSPIRVAVVPYERRLGYQLPYAIPAVFVVVIVCLIVLALLVVVCMGRTGFGKMRRFLHHTSVGRTLTTFVYPNDSYRQATTETWIRSVGVKPVDLSAAVPMGRTDGRGSSDHEPLIDQKGATLRMNMVHS
ncbi:predicted protein [Aspergillus terreus NIH2624]|uniref:Uncharacterized protein n=1 Tax=Aspergillus terreus (strain NIH 2624 / FGSC A1156) TaxID=341663 RepID=Q0CRP1_ASPTN|nr:uncharacterized protein ATEG_03643 [Aspergillus terreus NIH2624]EAU35445.1 predicted protein [Aspergillus terreus NIH2624]